MTYRERRERRAERLREWAEKRQTAAAATFAAGEQYRGDIAFATQPGHIPLRARVIAREDRAYESLRKAQSMESRADGIESQLATSIYSDDPDAVQQLRARIADLEAQRARIKAYNVSCRRGAPDLSLLSEAEQASLDSAQRWLPTKNRQMPSYHLANLSGNIARNRERLAQLEKQS